MIRILLSFICMTMLCTPAFGRTITDDSGQTVTFDKPFTRIISLYAAHSENLFGLGLEDEIIGVSRTEDYPALALQKTTFNARDGVEKFLAAKPDLILIRPMLKRGYPALWKTLKRHGITVVSLQPNTIDEMYDYWRTLGHLTGREMQAEYMIEDFKDGLVEADKRLDEFPLNERPTVFFESIHSKLSTFSPGSMPLFVLKRAGGINVATDARPRRGTNIASYGLERLLAKSNKIDVYLAQIGPMNQVSINTIKNGPAASRIMAVLNNGVFLVDEHLVSRPTMRLLQGIETVHELLHRVDHN
nr:ABC transporter substrate-binding protein [uncultured Pseudodesulfovibrio sp.]